MSGFEVIIRLAVVAALAGYLYAKHRQRLRPESERYDPAKWTGKAIDVTQLKPRVEDVRRNCLAVRQPAKETCFHRALLQLARHAVAQLAYFHGRAAEDHVSTHST
jgi:hypothetical protein